ncbi:tetratricopeptide repeat protein [Wenyingzhuangia sp. IMCC45533]
MKKQVNIIFALVVFFCLSVSAQNSNEGNHFLKWYAKGVLAFENENYALSKLYFNKIEDKETNYKNLDVYQLLVNIKLKEKKAVTDVELFLEKNPHSIHTTTLRLAVANYFFDKKYTSTALKWFDKIDLKALSDSEESDYHYKTAFANYRAENYAAAKQHLLALSYTGKYQEESNYYLANIAIQTKDYDTALNNFNKIKGVSKFKREIDYQTMVILYQKKEYDEVVKLGQSNFDNAIGFEKSEIAKIIGESYFHLQDYEKAVEHLSLFKGRRNNFTGTDYYFLGFAYYQQQNYKLAIENFNKITTEKSEVAQNAHYHLADCYLKLGKKTQALNAFKNASEMSFDADVQQDAYLNYAKLSYDIGNPYKSSSEVLQRFVDQYPNAKEATEIKGLIVNAYLQFKNYDEAIAYYNAQNLAQDKQYQQILLYKGLELYTDFKYKEALTYFTQVGNLQKDETLKNKALFWKAEAYTELSNYEEASYYYAAFLNKNNISQLEEYPNAMYGYGYSLFQQKKYNEALENFKRYESLGTNEAKKTNAILRIGDCYYVNKDYWKALEYYNRVIETNSSQADYATYQKALSYGFLGRSNQKISALKELQSQYKNSAYIDDSYSQLANLYVKQNQLGLALETYDVLINDYSKSPLVAKAMLKKGSLYFNLGKNQNSIQTLKKVVEKYPGTSEAVQAVKVAEQVYKEIDQVALYAAWVKELEFVNVSDLDIDKTMFAAVESRFLENKLEEAITSAKKYLINFPNGIYALTVHFYLAQSYYATGSKQKSIPHYKAVLEKNMNEYTEISTNRLSQIYLEDKGWDLAKPLLISLEKEASSEQNIIYAQSNLMKYYFVNKEYKQTLAYTQKVLENPKSSEQALYDAYVFGAKSAVETNQLDKAKAYYKKLETLGREVILAEANYYKALWLHLDKNYEKSNTQVQLLASKYQNYKYWGVKGLLLMAQNFHELNDNFQAIFILNNVLENAQEFKDITTKANDLLKRYDSQKSALKEDESKDVENEL